MTNALPGLTTPAALSQDYAANPTPIEQLRIEAGASGDDRLVATCTAALAGDVAAITTCERILAGRP